MRLRSLILKQPSCQQRMLYPDVVCLIVVGGGEQHMGVRGGVRDEEYSNHFLNPLLHLCY